MYPYKNSTASTLGAARVHNVPLGNVFYTQWARRGFAHRRNLQATVYTVEFWNFSMWCIPIRTRPHQLLVMVRSIMSPWGIVFCMGPQGVCQSLHPTGQSFYCRVLKFYNMMYPYKRLTALTFGAARVHNVPLGYWFLFTMGPQRVCPWPQPSDQRFYRRALKFYYVMYSYKSLTTLTNGVH